MMIRVHSSCLMMFLGPLLVQICNNVHAFDILISIWIHEMVEVADKIVPKSPKDGENVYQLLSSTKFISNAIKCKITEN